MKNRSFWSSIGRDASWLWIGYCVGWVHFVPTINFWKLLGYEIFGIVLIWVVCIILEFVINLIRNR